MLHFKMNLASGGFPIYERPMKQNGCGSNDFSSVSKGVNFTTLSALEGNAKLSSDLFDTASCAQASSAMDLLHFALKAMEANNNARLTFAANNQTMNSSSSPSPTVTDLAGLVADMASGISPTHAAAHSTSSLGPAPEPPVGDCHENHESRAQASAQTGHSDSIRVINLLNSSVSETSSSPSCVVAGADSTSFGPSKPDTVGLQAASPTPRPPSAPAPSLSSELSSMRNGAQSRYWSDEEHLRFLDGVRQCGAHDHKGIAVFVKTRSAAQVRSHGQKFFKKLNKHKGDGLPSMTRRKLGAAESVIDTSG